MTLYSQKTTQVIGGGKMNLSPGDFTTLDLLPQGTMEQALKRLGVDRGIKLLLFCHKLTYQALTCYANNLYSEFDPRVPTNCCHIIACLKSELFDQLDAQQLKSYLDVGQKKICCLERMLSTNVANSLAPQIKLSLKQLQESLDLVWRVPPAVLMLSKLRALRLAWESCGHAGHRSNPKNLEGIGVSLPGNFYHNLVKRYQKEMAQLAVDWCADVGELLPDSLSSSGIAIAKWRKYTQAPYLRKDACGRSYVSALFSMQVMLSYLKHTAKTIAIFHDHWSPSGHMVSRNIDLLRGRGESFEIMDEYQKTSLLQDKSVIVFAGFSQSLAKARNKPWDVIKKKWLSRFENLILACDTRYPQFPQVSDEFDSSPIKPQDELVNGVLEQHSIIPGFCAQDASLFCLTHIYVASLYEVYGAQNRVDLLPSIRPPNHTFRPNTMRTVA